MFLYFFILEDLSYIKIGRSSCLISRIDCFKSSSPHNVKVVGFFPSSGMCDESYILRKLIKFRVQGRREWFHGKHYNDVVGVFCEAFQHKVKWPKSRFDDLYGMKDSFLKEINNREELIARLKQGEL